MPPYEYRELDPETKEIRFIVLHPGRFEDPIQFNLYHRSFDFEPKPHITKRPRKQLQALQDSLPDGWSVYENVEGRIFYSYVDVEADTEHTSWTHPDPSFGLNADHFSSQSVESIENLPEYEALSYTWGSPKNPALAYVVDTPAPPGTLPSKSSAILEIGQSLACALKHLRYTTKSRTLWVDAVCINQKNMKERESQVIRMGTIYSRAARVVVWLGPELQDSKLALSTLEYIGSQFEIEYSGGMYGPSPACAEPEWYHTAFVLPYDYKTWKAIYNLLKVPWFTRVWILQEVQLGSPRTVIQCGKDQILWSLFRRAIHCIFAKYRNPLLEAAPDLNLPRVERLCRIRQSSTLPVLLHTIGKSQSTLPVDKLYGILGLVPTVFGRKITPDYTLTAEEVFRNAAIKWTIYRNRLELFRFCHPVGSPHNSSWVPNLTAPAPLDPISLIMGAGNATEDTAAFAKFLPPRTLEVTGIRCATIESTSQRIDAVSEIWRVIQSKGLDRLSTELYVTGEPLIDVYASVFESSLVHERYPLATWPKLEKVKENMIQFVQSYPAGGNFPSFMQPLLRRKFLFTKEGYFGFGPEASEPNDVICTFLGCKTPIILRPAGEKNNFRVVGECYVHGITARESILGPLPLPWKAQLSHDICRSLRWYYFNPETNETSPNDPRLNEVTSCWEPVEPEPWAPVRYRHKVTGEIVDSDPRLSPEALRTRGVKLEEFLLI